MKKFLFAFYISFFLLAIYTRVEAQSDVAYVPDKHIALPGDGGYDYLFVDQKKRRLYVSHGTFVHIINLDTDEIIGTIDGMQGNHGIAVSTSGKGFISDGKANSVLVFDPNTRLPIKTISLSGRKPDAILFDPFSNQVFAFNGSSDNVSVIDVEKLEETSTIALDGAPEFAVTDNHGKIFNNIEDKNVLKVIDSKNLKVINTYPLAPCGGPTGLAFDSVGKRLFTACRENKGMSVLNMTSGKVIATIPIGAGVDAVAFDAATKLIFCSNGDGTTTIIKQQSPDKYEVVQTLNTQFRAKTLALDPKTHKIYLSVVDFDAQTKKPIPGSFKVLVYKPAK